MTFAAGTQRPPRTLPVLYFAAAHAALLVAFAAVALDPRGAAGFFYHARMLGIVHLVTLGWITSSILGSLYVVGPVALRASVPARWFDYVAFALVVIGIVGMVAHFWIERYSGMAWSAATVAAGIMVAGIHVVAVIRRAPLAPAVKAHIVLAFANISAAAAFGILIGFDKVYHFLPGFVLTNVFAHAHLAAIGWASMMVVGVAYRLLPMVLPAEMPEGSSLWISAALLEIGGGGLFLTLVHRARFSWLFALAVVGGFAAFFLQVARMLRRPRTRPPGAPSPDAAVLHAGAAFVSLGIACALGAALTLMDVSPASLRIAAAYGVFGLVGFLAQIVVGMEGRLVPLLAWYWAYAIADDKTAVPSPHDMSWSGGRDVAFVLWLFGVPALAGGLAFDAVPFVRGAAWCLLAAALLDSANLIVVVRHAYRR